VSFSRLRHPFSVRPEYGFSADQAADIAIYRAFLLLGIAFNFLFWFVRWAVGPPLFDPLWLRGLFALIPASLFTASYGSALVRRHMRLLWQLVLYVLVAWFTALAFLNEMRPAYSIGCIFTVACGCLAFSVGLQKRRRLLPFLGWSGLLPTVAVMGVSVPRSERVMFLTSLLGLVVVSYLMLGRQVQVNQSLRRERNRLSTLYNNLPTPAVHLRWAAGESVVISVNDTFRTVFGVDPSGLSSEDFQEVIVPDRPGSKARARRLRQWVEEEASFQTEVERLTRQGVRSFQLNVARRSRAADVQEAYLIYTDITGRKRHERKLREAKEKAEEASRLKSTMLANMSHELRTPLTSIIGFSEVLEDELNGRLGSFAESVHGGGQRLMKTLEAMLRLSELEAEDASLRGDPVDLRRVVDETVELMEPKAKEKAITVAVDRPDSALQVPWKEEALHRVTTNLLDNAVKFTPENGHIDIRLYQEGDHACLEVKDTGVGISESAKEAIFQAFEQESEGKGRSHEGSGLGLAITKRFVETIGGTIEVESEKGKGTCFIVRVPQTPEPAEPSTASG